MDSRRLIFTRWEDLPGLTYDLVCMDFPMQYSGSQTKMGAAANHYKTLPLEEVIERFNPTRLFRSKKSWLYLWGACPRVPDAIKAIEAWGLHYRGMPFFWRKTRQDGARIKGQGVPPTTTHPVIEPVFCASLMPTGRPLPVLDAGMDQEVCAPKRGHSVKPFEMYEAIERLHGDCKRLDAFARLVRPGWDAFGDQVTGEGLRVGDTFGWREAIVSESQLRRTKTGKLTGALRVRVFDLKQAIIPGTSDVYLAMDATRTWRFDGLPERLPQVGDKVEVFYV